MDPAAMQAQMAQAQAMMGGMSPDQLRGQFAQVLSRLCFCFSSRISQYVLAVLH